MSENKKEKLFGVNDLLWGHKWGFKDSSFKINDDRSVTFTGNRYEGISGEKLPYLIPFVSKVLDTDINMAVVSTLPMPKKFKGLDCIDGDKDDLRFLDTKGVVVWLTAKGKGKQDTSGFVIH